MGPLLRAKGEWRERQEEGLGELERAGREKKIGEKRRLSGDNARRRNQDCSNMTPLCDETDEWLDKR